MAAPTKSAADQDVLGSESLTTSIDGHYARHPTDGRRRDAAGRFISSPESKNRNSKRSSPGKPHKPSAPSLQRIASDLVDQDLKIGQSPSTEFSASSSHSAGRWLCDILKAVMVLVQGFLLAVGLIVRFVVRGNPFRPGASKKMKTVWVSLFVLGLCVTWQYIPVEESAFAQDVQSKLDISLSIMSDASSSVRQSSPLVSSTHVLQEVATSLESQQNSIKRLKLNDTLKTPLIDAISTYRSDVQNASVALAAVSADLAYSAGIPWELSRVAGRLSAADLPSWKIWTFGRSWKPFIRTLDDMYEAADRRHLSALESIPYCLESLRGLVSSAVRLTETMLHVQDDINKAKLSIRWAQLTGIEKLEKELLQMVPDVNPLEQHLDTILHRLHEYNEQRLGFRIRLMYAIVDLGFDDDVHVMLTKLKASINEAAQSMMKSSASKDGATGFQGLQKPKWQNI